MKEGRTNRTKEKTLKSSPPRQTARGENTRRRMPFSRASALCHRSRKLLKCFRMREGHSQYRIWFTMF